MQRMQALQPETHSLEVSAPRRFFRNVLTVVVLSEHEPLRGDESLAEIAYAITDGDCSGKICFQPPEELTAKQVAEALRAQGSDPGFFRLDDAGNDTE